MKFCLFCGTFNPIHNAHLRIARYVRDVYGFEKIIFIPTYNPPTKNILNTSPYDRISMVRLALCGEECFELSDIEFESDEKSYTFNTIQKLNVLYNNSEKWPFIIGTDAFREIKSWYKSEELKKYVKFIILIRDKSFDVNEFEYLKQEGYDFEFTKLDFCDISSTEIRQKVQNGEDISELVTPEVRDYIYERGLYENKRMVKGQFN